MYFYYKITCIEIYMVNSEKKKFTVNQFYVKWMLL